MLRRSLMRRCSAATTPTNNSTAASELQQRFWAPLCEKTGPNLTLYDWKTKLGPNFLSTEVRCACNGFKGSFDVMENFAIVLLCGFDVKGVELNLPSSSSSSSSPTAKLLLKHNRTFIGWSPTGKTLEFLHRLELSSNEAVGGAEVNNIRFDGDFHEFCTSNGCPSENAKCLQCVESLKMLVALRRVNVRPEMISHRALLSATKKEASWSDALGIL